MHKWQENRKEIILWFLNIFLVFFISFKTSNFLHFQFYKQKRNGRALRGTSITIFMSPEKRKKKTTTTTTAKNRRAHYIFLFISLFFVFISEQNNVKKIKIAIDKKVPTICGMLIAILQTTRTRWVYYLIKWCNWERKPRNGLTTDFFFSFGLLLDMNVIHSYGDFLLCVFLNVCWVKEKLYAFLIIWFSGLRNFKFFFVPFGCFRFSEVVNKVQFNYKANAESEKE